MSDTSAIVGSLFAGLIWLALIVVFIAAVWIIFQKAGKAGWLSIIPFLNTYTLLQIVGRPG